VEACSVYETFRPLVYLHNNNLFKPLLGFSVSVMSKLVDTLSKFEKRKVAVIGDIMLDRYIIGDASRISPEAPVPVVKVKNGFYSPGGAGNTVVNIRSLGGEAHLIGVVGKDYSGRILKDVLEKRGVNLSGLVESSLRKTTRKDRIIAHKQQVVRIDYEQDDYISKNLEEQVVKAVDNIVKDCDVVVVSDYAKGTVTKDLMSYLIPLVHSANKHIIIDPKPDHKSFYKGCDFITPNVSEAKDMVGKFDDYRQLGRKLMKDISCNVLLTKGEHGMSLFTRQGTRAFLCEDFDAVTKDVYDVTGAGDTVVAAFALGLAAGASYEEAAKIANYAAGIVVGKFGSATTTREEILKVMGNYNKNNSKT